MGKKRQMKNMKKLKWDPNSKANAPGADDENARIPSINLKNLKLLVAAETTSKVKSQFFNLCAVDQNDVLVENTTKKITENKSSRAQQLKNLVRGQLQSVLKECKNGIATKPASGQNKALFQQAPNPKLAEAARSSALDWTVFHLRQLCRLVCPQCYAKHKETATKPQLLTSVCLNSKTGDLWCLPCYQQYLLAPAKRSAEKAAAPPVTDENEIRAKKKKESLKKKLKSNAQFRRKKQLKQQKEEPKSRDSVKDTHATQVALIGVQKRAERAVLDRSERRRKILSEKRGAASVFAPN